MEMTSNVVAHPRFTLYVPNSCLTQFHNRSPWLMFPRAFRNLGFEATLVCTKLATPCPEGVQLVESARLVNSEADSSGRKLLRRLLEPLLAFREIVRRGPDLLIISPVQSSLVAIVPMVLLYRLSSSRRMYVVLKVDSNLDAVNINPLIYLLLRALISVSTHVLDLTSVETSCALERIRRIPGVDKRKVVRVPIGSPQGFIERRAYDDVARDPVILCVARIARMKGQDVLLRAFSILAARYPQWSIRLVGPETNPTFKQELVDYVTSQGLEGRVAFIGFAEERVVDEEYARAAIFCLPSVHSENAGQVKYEATASGLPVVTTDVPCGRDAVDMGWQVAPAGNSPALAAALEALIRDRDARRALVKRAQSLQMSYEDVAKLYIRELDQRGLYLCNHTIMNK